MSTPTFAVRSTVLGTPDVPGLLAFWRDLLGWEVAVEHDEWSVLRPADGPAGLSFQHEADHVAPTWPAGPDDQQVQLHLDVATDDLDAGVERAVALGAVLADHQPQDDVRVLFDPAGHPFCLFVPLH